MLSIRAFYDGKTYYRLEIDRTGENAQPEDGLYFDYKTNAHLSNIYFKDATLVGHDFNTRPASTLWTTSWRTAV